MDRNDKKPAAKIIAIDSQRETPEPPEGGPASARAPRKFYSDPMTRRAFANLFFGGLAMGFSKAVHNARCTPTAASEELFDLGHEEWKRRRKERAA